MLSVNVFTSCSSDDEQTAPSATEKLEHIRSYVLADDGTNSYSYSSTDGIHNLPAKNAEQAHRFCEAIIGDEWNGQETKYTLAEDNGYINIIPAPKEGVFVSMAFRVKGIEAFTLEIASEAYCENENLHIDDRFTQDEYYTCEKCGKVYKKKPSSGCSCGNGDFSKHGGQYFIK